jgi:hypothetical protein
MRRIREKTPEIDGVSIELSATCPECLGDGTITEPVTCAGCKWWVQQKAYGKCKYFGCSWHEDSPNANGLSFACAAWEPRTVGIGDDEGDC